MNILIMCNCITEKCLERRNNSDYMAASSRKKLLAMSKELESLGHHVDISSVSFSKYTDRLFIENISKKIRILHAPTLGLWGITSFFKKSISMLFHIIWILLHLRHYQVMMIYNYHVEFSFPGLFAKLLSMIRIVSPFKLIMNYEDGLFLDKGFKGFFYRQWEKCVYNYVDTFLLVNEGLKNRVLEFFPDKQDFVTVNGFIDCDLLEKNKTQKHVQINRILFSGNFTQGFGFNQLIEYAENIEQSIIFDITGNAEQHEIETLKNRINHLPNVHFHGFLNETDFLNLIDGADAFVLLNDIQSPNNNTNFPSKFFDYLSRNKLVITSHNPILTEYYHIKNIILLKKFPCDVKRIRELSKTCENDYSGIKQLSKKIRDNLNKLITSDYSKI